jgi:hypothetical protein
MKVCYVLLAMAGVVAASSALAGVDDAAMGQCPFGSFAGTGFVVENASPDDPANWARGTVNGVPGLGWYDLCTSDEAGQSSPYRRKTTGLMTYVETWDQPQTLGTVMVASAAKERPTAGNIYVKMSGDSDANDPNSWTYVENFNDLTKVGDINFYDINRTGVYGVKIEVTGGDDTYCQIGSIGFYAERFVDVAYGMETFCSKDPAPGTMNMTDRNIGNASDFAFDTIGTGSGEQYVGVNFGEEKRIQGLLISTSAFGDQYAWKNFDVQAWVYVDDLGDYGWVTLGQASQASNTDLYWVDFGEGGVETSKIQLYGCVGDEDNGNHPDGKRISAIMAFEVVPPIPEPATMVLLALGGLAILRRRR